MQSDLAPPRPRGSESDLIPGGSNFRDTADILLIPAPRPLKALSLLQPSSPPRVHRSNRLTGKSRSRTESVFAEYVSKPWHTALGKFDIVNEHEVIQCFQIYAVEKWVVDRSKVVKVLAVYTGNPQHEIMVTALRAKRNSQSEFERVVKELRRDGARPHETPQGIIMATSLATFRSDYNIIFIPDGNYVSTRTQLYSNINLQRMGMSGRSALTLRAPNDAVKDNFLGAYSLPKLHAENINMATLDLVALLQGALSIFGLFDEVLDGLLCDSTMDGLQKWMIDIGEPVMSLEPPERIVDASVVSSILSLILSTRNKLTLLGYSQVTRDPFSNPKFFLSSVEAFLRRSQATGSGASLDVPALNADILHLIDAAYERSKHSDAYKVHRVLLSKFEEYTIGATDVSLNPTANLSDLAKAVVASERDAPSSMHTLWCGRIRGNTFSDEDDPGPSIRTTDDEENRRDDRASRDTSLPFVSPWTKRMESLLSPADYYISKFSKTLTSNLTKGSSPKGKERADRFTLDRSDDGRSDASEPSYRGSDILSEEQRNINWTNGIPPAEINPATGLPRDKKLRNEWMHRVLTGEETGLPEGATEAQESELNKEKFRRQRGLGIGGDLIRPSLLTTARVTSWADPVTAQARRAKRRNTEKVARWRNGVEDKGRSEDEYTEDEAARRRRLIKGGLRRRRSASDALAVADLRILPHERMRIDVDLCGQYLIMRRREPHLHNVLHLLEVLTTSMHAMNTRLRRETEDHARESPRVLQRSNVASVISHHTSEAASTRRDSEALTYEASQLFKIPELWSSASVPRHKVIGLRNEILKSRYGPNPLATAPFTRLQRGLDGSERPVDQLGRTESETEEDSKLPPIIVPDDLGVEDIPREVKPTLSARLLQLFTHWGARWGLTGRSEDAPPPANDQGTESGNGHTPVGTDNTRLDDHASEASNRIRKGNSF